MKEKVAIQDNYIYLVILYRIIMDCYNDFNSFRVEYKNDFWKVNKYLLNYVNAIYSFKEYIKNCYGQTSDVYKIVDGYYQTTNWYTFLCNYRNRIIHQSAVIKDYDVKSGDAYIDFDDLIELTKLHIKSSRTGEENGKKFIRFLERQYPKTKLNGDHHYMSAKRVFNSVNNEVKAMANKIFIHLYEKELKDSFTWFLSMTLQDKEERYLSTYIIQDETNINFQTNYYLEDYIVNIMFTLGKSFDVVNMLIKFLKDEGYLYFFTQNCSLEELETVLDDPENLN